MKLGEANSGTWLTKQEEKNRTNTATLHLNLRNCLRLLFIRVENGDDYEHIILYEMMI